MLQRIKQFWSDLPLSLKGLVVIGLPIVTILLTAILTTLVLGQLREAETLANQAYQTQLELQKVQNLVLNASTGVRGYLLTERDDLLELYHKANDAFPLELAVLTKQLQRYPEQLEQFEEAREQIEQEFSALGTLISLSSSLGGSSPETINGFIVTSQVVMEALERQLTALQDDLQILIENREASRQGILTRYYSSIAISIIVGILSSIFGIQLFASGITRRVKKLSQEAKRLSNGYTVRFPRDSRDEIGQLSSTLEQASNLLGARENELKQASNVVREKFEELTLRHHQIILLSQLGGALQHSDSISESFTIIADKISALCPNTSGSIYLHNEMLNAFRQEYGWGEHIQSNELIIAQQCRAFDLQRHYTFQADKLSYCGHFHEAQPDMSLCISLTTQDRQLGLIVLTGNVPLSEDQRQILGAMSDRIALALLNLQLRDSLLQQAIRDPLTGLFNRRYLDETLERELQRAKRSESPLSLIVADIDHFKQINDRFGHNGGDEVLRAIGSLLSSSFRSQDIACRYGGEEFVIVLPETQLEDALRRAEALRQQIKSMRIELEQGSLELLSISIGVASYPTHGQTSEIIMRNADTAMYRAKNGGRDRVETAFLTP